MNSCLDNKLNRLNALAKCLRVAVLVGLLFSGLLIAASSIGFAAAADVPPTQWSQTYGGTAEDEALSVVENSDGGYTLAGNTNSYGAGDSDAWLIKVDASGVMQWSQTYGGIKADVARCMIKTDDGGYAIAGYTRSFGAGNTDFWLVKTDASGTEQWSQTYGGITADEYAWCVIQTSDGGYALTGTTESVYSGQSDAWLVKTDAFGVEQWNQTYGGTDYASASCVVQNSDGSYVIAGCKYLSDAGLDALLVKVDASGTEQWSQTYGGTREDEAYSVVKTSDGGYALAGYTESFGAGNTDFWLVKTDASGTEQWSQTYGGTRRDEAYSVVKTSDGGYVIAGFTNSFGAGNDDAWLVKVDASGTAQWSQTYGGAGDDLAMCVVVTNDGGYALTGGSGPDSSDTVFDFWLVRIGTDSLFVVPESPLGAAGALIACAAAMAIIATNKKHHNK